MSTLSPTIELKTQPPTARPVGRPRMLPADLSEILKVISDNEYRNIIHVADHYGINRSTVQISPHYDQIKEAVNANREVLVERIDNLLYEKLKTNRAGAAEFSLAYKRYGDQTVRDSLKSQHVIETNNDEIIPLTDFE